MLTIVKKVKDWNYKKYIYKQFSDELTSKLINAPTLNSKKFDKGLHGYYMIYIDVANQGLISRIDIDGNIDVVVYTENEAKHLTTIIEFMNINWGKKVVKDEATKYFKVKYEPL